MKSVRHLSNKSKSTFGGRRCWGSDVAAAARDTMKERRPIDMADNSTDCTHSCYSLARVPFVRKKLLPFVVVSAALMLSACIGVVTPIGPEQRESRSVELDKSERVRMELKMPVGELNVGGGARKLLDA